MTTIEVEHFKKHLNYYTRTSHHGKIDHVRHKQHADGTNPDTQISVQQNTQNHQYPIRDRKRHKNAHNVHKRRKAKHI